VVFSQSFNQSCCTKGHKSFPVKSEVSVLKSRIDNKMVGRKDNKVTVFNRPQIYGIFLRYLAYFSVSLCVKIEQLGYWETKLFSWGRRYYGWQEGWGDIVSKGDEHTAHVPFGWHKDQLTVLPKIFSHSCQKSVKKCFHSQMSKSSVTIVTL